MPRVTSLLETMRLINILSTYLKKKKKEKWHIYKVQKGKVFNVRVCVCKKNKRNKNKIKAGTNTNKWINATSTPATQLDNYDFLPPWSWWNSLKIRLPYDFPFPCFHFHFIIVLFHPVPFLSSPIPPANSHRTPRLYKNKNSKGKKEEEKKKKKKKEKKEKT